MTTLTANTAHALDAGFRFSFICASQARAVMRIVGQHISRLCVFGFS